MAKDAKDIKTVKEQNHRSGGYAIIPDQTAFTNPAAPSDSAFAQNLAIRFQDAHLRHLTQQAQRENVFTRLAVHRVEEDEANTLAAQAGMSAAEAMKAINPTRKRLF